MTIKRKIPLALNSKKLAAVNVDARTDDRATWATHVCETALGTKASPSVIYRRAMSVYAGHLEKLLSTADATKLEREVDALRMAAKGEPLPLPAGALNAIPPRPLSEIEHEAAKAATAKARGDLRSYMGRPFDPDGYRG